MTIPACILGVDPGLTGAIAFVYPDYPALVAVMDMPVADKLVDPATLASRLRTIRPVAAMIEQVWARPGEGPVGAFKFGQGYGEVIGVLAALGVPRHFVSPQRWKKHHRLDADKEKARAMALRLWPGHADRFSRKKDAGRAEAALIARYAAETLGSHQVGPWSEAE